MMFCFLQMTTQIQPNPWIFFHIAKKRIGSHKKSMKIGGDKLFLITTAAAESR